jgi:ubiquitin-protein ligase
MMPDTTRQERLISDLRSLESLKANSSVFDYLASGDPPDVYEIVFRGQGVRRDAHGEHIQLIDEHRCELRLNLSYPERPPDVRWMTALLHPNISFGGFIRLSDIGLPWHADLELEAICERLWDVARLAYFDLENATNHAARQWLATQQEFALPVDPRPLRDRIVGGNTNIVRYERRDGRGVLLPQASEEGSILYIDEDTPVPTLPSAAAPQRPDDDEIIYIGE